MRTQLRRDVYTRSGARFVAWISLLVSTLTFGCGGCSDKASDPPPDVVLVLAAYSAPREVLQNEILPAFTADYRKKTGKSVRVEASYLASGAQTRAVIGGFAADVVLLAMSPDIDKLAGEGLVSADWANGADRGIVASTVVAFAVRTGNPKRILDWPDLARPGVSVLMPNPRTSGGAAWNVSALWGAALRGNAGFPPGDYEATHDYLRAVLKNVAVLDKGGRESVITFEKGMGDVAITYESEIVAGKLAGRVYDAVVPNVTMLVEIPASVTTHAPTHGALAEAEALVAYLRSDSAQHAFKRYGFRPPNGEGESGQGTPALFRIQDLGGWKSVMPSLFGPGGAFTKTWEEVYAQ